MIFDDVVVGTDSDNVNQDAVSSSGQCDWGGQLTRRGATGTSDHAHEFFRGVEVRVQASALPRVSTPGLPRKFLSEDTNEFGDKYEFPPWISGLTVGSGLEGTNARQLTNELIRQTTVGY